MNPVRISGYFTAEELADALQDLEPGKITGLDSILSVLIMQVGVAPKSWRCGIFRTCLRQLQIRRICRQALVVTIL